jgi:hypothetical protein
MKTAIPPNFWPRILTTNCNNLFCILGSCLFRKMERRRKKAVASPSIFYADSLILFSARIK